MISSVFGPLIVFVLRSRSESANNCSNKCAIGICKGLCKGFISIVCRRFLLCIVYVLGVVVKRVIKSP